MISTKPPFKSLSSAERIQLFGKFAYKPIGNGDIRITDDWAAKNVVRVFIKQLIGIEGAPKDGIIQWHKAGVEQIQGFFQAVEDRGKLHLLLSWAGSFYPRFVRGKTTSLSNHSWATAFDINAAWNGLGRTPAPVGAKGSIIELVPIAHEFGFYWGGNFKRNDGMHFELAKIIVNGQPIAVIPVIKAEPEFKIIGVGAKGVVVTKIQQRLFELGFMKSTEIDGDYGRITRSAVSKFQLSVKLGIDGLVGKFTWNKLFPDEAVK